MYRIKFNGALIPNTSRNSITEKGGLKKSGRLEESNFDAQPNRDLIKSDSLLQTSTLWSEVLLIMLSKAEHWSPVNVTF